jgi:hypothetical protein
VLDELPKYRHLGLSEDVIYLLRNEYYIGFWVLLIWVLIPMIANAGDAAKLEVITISIFTK